VGIGDVSGVKSKPRKNGALGTLWSVKPSVCPEMTFGELGVRTGSGGGLTDGGAQRSEEDRGAKEGSLHE